MDRLTNYIAGNPGDGTANPDQGNDGDEDTTPPVSSETLANGKPVTEENVLEILKEIEAEYPDETPWGTDKVYHSVCFGTGKECAAFAFMVSDRIFGKLAFKRTVTDYNSIRPGDVITQNFHLGLSIGMLQHLPLTMKAGSPVAVETAMVKLHGELGGTLKQLAAVTIPFTRDILSKQSIFSIRARRSKFSLERLAPSFCAFEKEKNTLYERKGKCLYMLWPDWRSGLF